MFQLYFFYCLAGEFVQASSSLPHRRIMGFPVPLKGHYSPVCAILHSNTRGRQAYIAACCDRARSQRSQKVVWAGGGVAWVRITHAVIPVWEMGGRGAQQSVLEEPPAKLMHPHV